MMGCLKNRQEKYRIEGKRQNDRESPRWWRVKTVVRDEFPPSLPMFRVSRMVYQ